MTRKLILPAALLAFAAGCGGGGSTAAKRGSGASEGASPKSAARVFADLEARLLAAKAFRFKATITSTGAVTSRLEGAATVGAEAVNLAFVGEVEGNNMTIFLDADAETMKGGSGQMGFESARAEALQEALAIGLTRMGILHNLAVLGSGKPPDRARGGVSSWVVVSNERFDGKALAFDIAVGGQPAAVAKLWLDETTGLPVRREQTVSFPSGTMTAVEEYEGFSVEE